MKCLKEPCHAWGKKDYSYIHSPHSHRGSLLRDMIAEWEMKVSDLSTPCIIYIYKHKYSSSGFGYILYIEEIWSTRIYLISFCPSLLCCHKCNTIWTCNPLLFTPSILADGRTKPYRTSWAKGCGTAGSKFS